MKPPFVRITAECSHHGKFQVEKKPNKYRPDGWTSPEPWKYSAVVCPKCPLWGKIINQELIEQEPETTADSQAGLF